MIKPSEGDAFIEEPFSTACENVGIKHFDKKIGAYPSQALVSIVNTDWKRVFRCQSFAY